MPIFDREVTADYDDDDDDEPVVTLHRALSVSATVKPHVADAYFDKDIRVIVLLIEVIAGVIGGACVIFWLWTNKKRRYRVNVIILNVTLTDLLVVCFACGMQLIWELVDREWRAGDVLCRLLKWAQSFAMMSSNNMLVVLSIDRHNAIRSPLKEPISVLKMVGAGWVLGAVLSLPQLIVFRENHVTTDGIFQNKTVCEAVFRYRPPSHRQAYLTFISLVDFFIPLVVIVICYVRIYMKIARKADEFGAGGGGRRQSEKAGKIRLQCTKSSSLPKAKVKTLRMTVVIVACFIVCGLPYHILESIMSYGDHTMISGVVMAVVGATAVANSSINPFVFLVFNASSACLRRVCRARRSSASLSEELSQNVELRTSAAQTRGGGGHAVKTTTTIVHFERSRT